MLLRSLSSSCCRSLAEALSVSRVPRAVLLAHRWFRNAISLLTSSLDRSTVCGISRDDVLDGDESGLLSRSSTRATRYMYRRPPRGRTYM